MSHEQQRLLTFCAPAAGVIVVNDRVCIRTEGSRRVVLVHGVIVVAHYDISDRAAEEYAMLTLFGSGYADQDSGFGSRSREAPARLRLLAAV